jgi:hypothetical protein
MYLRTLRKHGEWALKSQAKFLLGRHEWLACQMAWLDLWRSLIGLPALVRSFKDHYPEIIRFKEAHSTK